MKYLRLIFATIFALLMQYSGVDSMQCLTVRGRARCGLGESPFKASPVFIKLVDRDTGRIDDDMDETYASKHSGAFQMWGCASDPVGSIDPELRIFHKCKGRERMVTLVVPQQAIGREYNFTEVINLQGNFQHEKDKKYPVPKCTAQEAKLPDEQEVD